jgi:hypothetical protein
MRVARLRGFAGPLFFEGDYGGGETMGDLADCKRCSRWQELKQKLRITKLLSDLIGGVEERAEAKELKPTVAEYLKLLQIEQEMEQESPKEIKVTWVEPGTTSSGEK